MPDQADRTIEASLYDVEPIADFIERGLTLVTPNQRLATRVKTAWNEYQKRQGKKAWRSPSVMPLEQWVRESWQQYSLLATTPEAQRVLMDHTMQLQLWERCVLQSSWGETLLRTGAAAQQASSAYRTLKLWQLDLAHSSMRQQFEADEDSAAFYQWMMGFESLCQKGGYITAEQCLEVLLKDSQSASTDSLVLLEFDDIPPLHESFFAHRSEQCIQHRASREQARCFSTSCEDDEDELYAAAHWAATVLEQQAGATVALLHPQSAQQRSRIERVFSEILDPASIDVGSERYAAPFNFSAGSSLQDAPPVVTACHLLDLIKPLVKLETVKHCLNSRFCLLPDQESNRRNAAVNALHRRGQEQISAANLRFILLNGGPKENEFSEPDVELSQGLSLGRSLLSLSQNRVFRSVCAPSQWVEICQKALDSFGWPGAETLDSIEYQQVEQWHRVLQELERFDEFCGALNFGSFLSLLNSVLKNTIFQAKTPDSPVQILGLLEGAGLQFSHVWVAGMGHLDWPPTASPNPFIPVSLQRYYRMPHADAEREYQFCQQLLQHYRHSADALIFSYVETRDGIEQQISGLLDDIDQMELIELLGDRPEQGYRAYWQRCSGVELEYVDQARGPNLSPEEQVRGGSGLLEDQSACAFRAFSRYRLGARALDELQPGLSALDQGNLLHTAQYYFWGEVTDSEQLAQLPNEMLEREIEQAVSNSVVDFLKKAGFNYGEHYLRLEQQRLRDLLKQWLDIEKQRQQFVVIGREQSASFDIGPLTISLRIDRIDRTEDELLLIDYKSGNCDIKHWFGERPEKPQLPLYALALDEPVRGITYAQVKSGEAAYIGVAASQHTKGIMACDGPAVVKKTEWQGDWGQLTQHWQSQISRLGQEFLDGVAEVSPRHWQQTCRYCELSALCRKHEVTADE